MSERVLWHDVECGGYRADLPLWSTLADEAGDPVLELGCGTGRVALELAERGVRVTGVDRDPALVAALRSRAEERGIEIEAVVGDARDLALEGEFALVLAPMQLVHLLGGECGRRSMLRSARAHLGVGGRLAVALLAPGAGTSPALAPDRDGGAGPLPDVCERDGWIHSSLPIGLERVDGTLELRRLRQTVSPHGELSEALEVTCLDLITRDQFEAEAAAEGFSAHEPLEIPATADHVGSTIVVLDAR